MKESAENGQEGTKESLLELKDFTELQEKDYRGILALMIVAGFLMTIIACIIKGDIEMLTQIAAILGSPVSAVITWYFMSKRK